MHKRYKFRNPENQIRIPDDFKYSRGEYLEALNYIEKLNQYNIKFTHPSKKDYPKVFYKMKEPPLFIEYWGQPLWNEYDFLAVVGARQIHELTENWLRSSLNEFVKTLKVGIVSGGAIGVDQFAHLIAIKNKKPTIFVLPSGLKSLYPRNLSYFKTEYAEENICFMSEFEYEQTIHKSHFYYRNRLIAAMGVATLLAQANLKSGSFHTIHHCLENGRPVVVVPSHPGINGFEGNLKLLSEGALLVRNGDDLLDFWKAENWTS